MVITRIFIFLVIGFLFSNCSNRFQKKVDVIEKLDKIHIDSIKYLTYQAINIQDCSGLKVYMTKLLFQVDCSSNFGEEYMLLRDSIKNYNKTLKLIKQRDGNNCVFIENYFDAVCISIKFRGLTKDELPNQILNDIRDKKLYKTNYQPEKILLGHSLSFMEVDDVIIFYNNQGKEDKEELISCFSFSDDYIKYCTIILLTENDESIVFYLNAVLRDHENRNRKAETNKLINKTK